MTNSPPSRRERGDCAEAIFLCVISVFSVSVLKTSLARRHTTPHSPWQRLVESASAKLEEPAVEAGGSFRMGEPGTVKILFCVLKGDIRWFLKRLPDQTLRR